MEPTTNTNKTKIVIMVIIIAIIFIVGIFVILNAKNKALPTETTTQEGSKDIVVKTVTTEAETKELTEYIDSATTFDNASLLADIDKEF